ncbi:hypothetical protein RRG08_009928 [Elysia crispata]|uniref:Uncharacterized protein n=1 Tax=Elysia crispata TaxID=231223 RepID=A0AAE1E306_9GAST|nr:hypothetical protein RRG08_009928 [Elysia crispata]
MKGFSSSRPVHDPGHRHVDGHRMKNEGFLVLVQAAPSTTPGHRMKGFSSSRPSTTPGQNEGQAAPSTTPGHRMKVFSSSRPVHDPWS